MQPKQEILLHLVDFHSRAVDRAALGVEHFNHRVLFAVEFDIALRLRKASLLRGADVRRNLRCC